MSPAAKSRPARSTSPRSTALRFALGECRLGALLVAGDQQGLCAVLLGDHPQALRDELQARFAGVELAEDGLGLADWLARVAAFIAAPQGAPGLPLAPRGTPFQLRVWQALQDIPAGQTLGYAALAARIGAPRAVRAVAAACAANPLAVVIPCHRVLRSDGGLGGYRWGVARKRALLALEGSASL